MRQSTLWIVAVLAVTIAGCSSSPSASFVSTKPISSTPPVVAQSTSSHTAVQSDRQITAHTRTGLFKVDSILLGSTPVARIDGQIVRVGDFVAGDKYQVVAITAQSVTIESDIHTQVVIDINGGVKVYANKTIPKNEPPISIGTPSSLEELTKQKSKAVQGMIQPYYDGLAALEQYRATADCANDTRDVVIKNILLLRVAFSLIHEAQVYETSRILQQYHTDLAFAFAEEALKRKCFDDADMMYRSMIKFYVGSSYGGVRDRARIGIDDVRTARATAQVPSE